ncbi:TetR/AcrR family transcriptional regulator [Haloactinomyces albus]|uniref:AcrR family transcriptional regulator n=1 Tax=Haloactinomyces albus TaxID=1352928 RepID=A0AAE3ZHB9_9ACTN|nr:TetR/AcrR family transcriptional regulator [Haloactinomyces albus]MDR7303680.1 AcrR family transcriptional regulator [Haloactinomyces albus]
MTQQRPLRERHRQRAKEKIIDAAFALFAERGFADVTVTEITDQAEVGRTTFFRYFGDKQEVLFADEQPLLDQLAHAEAPLLQPPTFQQAMAQTRTVVRDICDQVTADPERYRLHERLVGDNPELHDRSERKLLRLTEAMTDALRNQGVPEYEAVLAPHLALACYRTGKHMAGTDPTALVGAVDAAFELLERARGAQWQGDNPGK